MFFVSCTEFGPCFLLLKARKATAGTFKPVGKKSLSINNYPARVNTESRVKELDKQLPVQAAVFCTDLCLYVVFPF